MSARVARSDNDRHYIIESVGTRKWGWSGGTGSSAIATVIDAISLRVRIRQDRGGVTSSSAEIFEQSH